MKTLLIQRQLMILMLLSSGRLKPHKSSKIKLLKLSIRNFMKSTLDIELLLFFIYVKTSWTQKFLNLCKSFKIQLNPRIHKKRTKSQRNQKRRQLKVKEIFLNRNFKSKPTKIRLTKHYFKNFKSQQFSSLQELQILQLRV